MSLTSIDSIETLKNYLHVAMQLEHATIPPYLSALYSIRPGTNSDASHILRVVVVEEMLHLTIAANLLNAVGGKPDLGTVDFVPEYPTPLPNGETDFEVSLERFSKESVETFLKIERPAKAPSEDARTVARRKKPVKLLTCPHDQEREFYSIGEFYEEIARGLRFLNEKIGEELFCGDPQRQVTSEYYYSGGGELNPVTDMASAQAGIELITGQGEGMGGGIYDSEKELAHYYRFDQLTKGRYYVAGDKPGEPSGPTFEVEWGEVFPTKTNPRISDYSPSKELTAAAERFNQVYAEFLRSLTVAFNGKPEVLLDAVPKMFHVRDTILQLIHNPIPGLENLNAAPTFEVGKYSEGRRQ